MMKQTETVELVERMAQGIMGVNLIDLSTLGVVCADMDSLAEMLDDSRPQFRDLLSCLQEASEKVIMDECEGVEDPLDVLVSGVELLQQAELDYGRNGTDSVEGCQARTALEQLARGGDEPAAISDEQAESQDPGSAFLDEGPSGDEASTVLGAVVQEEEESESGTDEEDGPEPAEESTPPPAAPTDSEAVAVDPDIFGDFSTEAEDHLNSAETVLLSLENSPADDELLNTVFRSFHTVKGAAGFLGLSDIGELAHAVEDVLDSARKGKLTVDALILDVALESVDALKTLMSRAKDQIEDNGNFAPSDVSALVDKVEAVVSGDVRAARTEATQQIETPPKQEREPEAPTSGTPGAAKARTTESQVVRVGTDKLDELVNMVGELVIAQTQITHNEQIAALGNEKTAKDVSQLTKISKDLQEVAMSMRMVPIKGTFERMARVIRDVARKCGRQVSFHMFGEDTELDKNMVEALVDPLTHMVRNAVDHGVESAEDRVAVGKPEEGVVELEAYHRAGSIVIELRDDGHGIDRDKVLEKARAKGVVGPDEELTDSEVYGLVFHPGLSTAEKVSDVSGRGVGMDVVRRNVEELRGQVDVQSEKGKGSTFSIQLPLTLAIIDGMVVGVGEEKYILPLTSILNSLRPLPEQISTVLDKGEMVRVQDELLPLVRVHERFDVVPRFAVPSEGLVVVIEADGERCCLLVDELVGLQQVVIKGLHEDLRQEQSVSGCAILGDGRVGLILDATGLIGYASGRSRLGERSMRESTKAA